ncbi:MAG: WecB/TagA/CpsF family glycosyltransferase [Planctomycetes bacterium]|nr:WecB/TagA/CpsF family glycosyltransferase [Planctomycetota bacterium]
MYCRRINVLGVGISSLTLDSAVEAVLDALNNQQQGYVTVTGVHGVSECQTDAELRRIHNDSLLSTPDGMPLTWMGRLQGASREQMDRVYGPDLMLRVFERGQQEGLRHYLFGGGEGVVELLQEKLTKRFPTAQVVGTYTPPFRPLTDDEEYDFVEQLNQRQPHCLWVGLSTPKQERIMARLLSRYGAEGTTGADAPRLPTPLVMFGVGAAFDFHAGLIPQAPHWMQRSGLEWFYRLQKEPRRLWKRYLKNNPLFLARAALQISGLRKYELPNKMSSQPGSCNPQKNGKVTIAQKKLL